MKQSRTMSLIESLTNIVVGYGLAVGTQLLIFPYFGLPARASDAFLMGIAFTVVSLVRSFTLRRIFESLRIHSKGDA